MSLKNTFEDFSQYIIENKFDVVEEYKKKAQKRLNKKASILQRLETLLALTIMNHDAFQEGFVRGVILGFKREGKLTDPGEIAVLNMIHKKYTSYESK